MQKTMFQMSYSIYFNLKEQISPNMRSIQPHRLLKT